MKVMLYVGNLAKSVTETDLRTLFSQVGEVTTIRIIRDWFSGESQQYGFVTMSARSEADDAINRFHKYSLGEHLLRVGLVKPRRRTGRPGPLIGS
ncbi:MAG: RNA recognition motif domain-containing protein [Anaerolineae bacterium]